jgi:hypothetical protein
MVFHHLGLNFSARVGKIIIVVKYVPLKDFFVVRVRVRVRVRVMARVRVKRVIGKKIGLSFRSGTYR